MRETFEKVNEKKKRIIIFFLSLDAPRFNSFIQIESEQTENGCCYH